MKKKNGLVSIIIPFYNTDIKLFKNCIETVISQDYSNKEIIIIDDGSKEEYARELDYLSSHENGVRVIHQKNAGEGAARNAGIKASKGEYVVFVDSDDGLSSGWITYSVTLLEKYNADIVTGEVVRVHEIPKKQIVQKKIEECYVSVEKVWQLQKDFFYFKSSFINNLNVLDPGVCSKLIRKKCIKDLSFPIGIKLSSDQVFNHEMIKRSNGVIITNRVSYYYVMNENSISHIYQPKAIDYMMKSMSLIKPNVFDKSDCKQAFSYRVLAEMTEAIQYAYFSDKGNISFINKIKGVRYASYHDEFRSAIQQMNINFLPNKSWKLKAFLLKNHLCIIFVVLKLISDKMESN